jgi:hypothetical protein
VSNILDHPVRLDFSGQPASAFEEVRQALENGAPPPPVDFNWWSHSLADHHRVQPDQEVLRAAERAGVTPTAPVNIRTYNTWGDDWNIRVDVFGNPVTPQARQAALEQCRRERAGL